MKRVILSRKGFDSKYGGRPSPIFKNDDIFSLPIPQNGKSPKKYHELKFNGINGTQALKEVSATQVTSEDFCHYDPALNDKIGLFGQAGSAQSELKNNGVGLKRQKTQKLISIKFLVGYKLKKSWKATNRFLIF